MTSNSPQRVEDYQWLSETARKLSSLVTGEEILDCLGQTLQDRMEKALVVTLSRVQDQKLLTVEGVYGQKGNILSRVTELAGFDLRGKSFPLEERLETSYQSRELHRFPGKLEDFIGDHLPSPAVRVIQDVLSIQDVFTIGLIGKERMLGNIHIFTLPGEEIPAPALIESFIYQGALALERAEVTRELRESERFHRQVFEGTTDALLIADQEGAIAHCNVMACRLYGYSREELVGLKIEQLVHPEDHHLLEEFLSGKGEEGLFSGQNRGLRKEGRVFPAELRGRTIQIQGEDYRLASVRDVSTRKETQRELTFRRQLWESLLQNTPDLVYFKDDQHRLVMASRAYGQIFDQDTQELMGLTADDLWPQEAAEIMADEREVLRGEPMFKKERKATLPDGEERWYSLTKIPIYEGKGITGFFAIDKDITERKMAEQEREQTIQELELINEVILEVSRLETTDEICQVLAERLYEFHPQSIVAVSLLDPEQNTLRPRTVIGLGGLVEQAAQALGTDPEDMEVALGDEGIAERLREFFLAGKMVEVPGGLYEFLWGSVPRLVCESLEHLLGIERVFTVGFSLDGLPRGGVTLFLKRGQNLRYKSAIETIASQVAVIIERRQAARAIQHRTAQLEAFHEVEHHILSELELSQLLEVIVNRAVDLVDAHSGGFSRYLPDQDRLEYIVHTRDSHLPEKTCLEKGQGLSGRVWQEGEPLVVDDYAQWEGCLPEWLVALGNFSALGVPVWYRDEFLGVLAVYYPPGEAQKKDAGLLEFFATQSAMAIQNARLFDQERQKRREAETLREIGLMISKVGEVREVERAILDQLQVVLPYHSASLQLISGEQIIVDAVAGRLSAESVVGRSFPIAGDELLKPIIDRGEIVVVRDVQEHDSWIEHGDTEFIHSWIGAPLEVQGKRIGVLTVDHSEIGKYTREDGDLVRSYANQAAVLIENARLFEETERQAQELKALYQSTVNIAREVHPDQMLTRMSEQVYALFAPDSFLVARYDPYNYQVQRICRLEEDQIVEDLLWDDFHPESEGELMQWVIQHRESLLVPDLQASSRIGGSGEKGGLAGSWLGVPLLAGDHLVGAMAIRSGEAAGFSDREQRLLELLAGQAAVALEKSRLFDEAQLRMKRLSSLREIDRAISGTVDLGTTLEVLLSQLLNTLDVHAAAVLFFDPALQNLEYITGKGFHSCAVGGISFRLGEGQASQVALDRRLVYIKNLGDRRPVPGTGDIFQQEGFVTYFGIPLIAKGELVGVLEVFHRREKKLGSEWLDFLEALADQAAIAIDRLNLLSDLKQSNLEMIQAYEATIEGWARAIELRDSVTEGHSRRVERLTLKVAEMMGIPRENLAHVRRGALLHDIGKMAIPDRILLKPGKLTEEEWVEMKTHPVYAREMLSRIDFLRPALDIPTYHHERWDGSGYPEGLSGENIPLAARIFAVVDVWDALQSDRPYRQAWSRAQAVEHLEQESGKHFDPEVVEVFLDFLHNTRGEGRQD